MENQPKEKPEEKEVSQKEKFEFKKRFVSINDLSQKESKMTNIFNKSKKKLIDNKPSLFLRPHNYQFNTAEYKPLFQYESTFPLKVKQEFSFIYDCLNFICYDPKDEEDSKNPEKYTQKIKNVFAALKEKGTLLKELVEKIPKHHYFINTKRKSNLAAKKSNQTLNKNIATTIWTTPFNSITKQTKKNNL